MGPLSGVRVVDFTWALAGPYATELLAFLGAQVIKIESTQRLDLLRRISGVLGMEDESDPEKSPQFNTINLNKLGITLNLSHPKGVALVKQLVKTADVVMDNFSPGVIERLGLGYTVLRQVRPDIIMLSLSAAGRDGPENPLGYALIFAALGGLGHITGYPDGAPGLIRAPVDAIVASTAAFAILAALAHRQETGQGQYIDLSATEAVSCLIGDSLMEYTMNARSPARMGNGDQVMAPHNLYRCAGEERWVSIAVGSEAEWRGLCRALGNPPWTREKRFASPLSRWQHQEDLDRLISQWTQSRSPWEVTELLQRRGVAAFPCLDARDVFTDGHLKERGYAVEVEHPRQGRNTVSGPPWKMSATPPQVLRPAPLLGQHQDLVFGELLGLSPQEIEVLRREGVFD